MVAEDRIFLGDERGHQSHPLSVFRDVSDPETPHFRCIVSVSGFDGLFPNLD